MKVYYRIRRIIREISRYHVSLYASNAAFYIVLSVFPSIMLVLGVLPYFGFREADLLHALRGVVPEIIYPLLQQIIEDMGRNSSGVLLSATAIVAVWSSSRGVYCIRRGLNYIYGLKESRPYLIRRLISMLYTLLLLLALVLTLVVHGFGNELSKLLQGHNIPILLALAKLLQFRGLIIFILLTLLFSAVFCVFPNRKMPWKSALPGAAIAAFGWLVFTFGYSLYVKVSGSYSVLYGSLSTVAMGMIWLYICISILFYGSVLNLYLERRV